MFTSNRQFKVLAVSALSASLFLTGCATKNYVKKTVDAKIAPLDKKVTDLSAAVKDNSERIDAVDRRATQGIAGATTAAATAQTAANAAQASATQAGTAAAAANTSATTAQRAADTANGGVTTANTRITTVDAKFNLVDRYTAGPVQTVLFKVGSSKLSDDAKRTLDGVAGPVASLTSGYRVEIQGFASIEGSEASNVALSEARAGAVERYLVSKGVPVIRISDIGVGAVGDKKDNKAAKEANRKVEVRVFTAAK